MARTTAPALTTLVATMLVLVIPALAFADEVWIARAPIAVDGEDVGHLESIPVEIAGVDGDRIDVRYRDAILELDATVDLADESTFVEVGFKRRTRVDNDSGYVIRALAGAYAPLFRVGAREYEIALPDWMPAEVGRVSRRTQLPREQPEPAPFTARQYAPASAPTVLRCDGAELRPSPRSAQRWTIPTFTALYEIAPARNGLVRVAVVDDEGFIVEGYTPVPPCTERSFSTVCHAGGSSGGRPRPQLDVTNLPPQTTLLAADGSSAPFATIGIATVAHREEPNGRWHVDVCTATGIAHLVYAAHLPPSGAAPTASTMSCSGAHFASNLWPPRPGTSTLP